MRIGVIGLFLVAGCYDNYRIPPNQLALLDGFDASARDEPAAARRPFVGETKEGAPPGMVRAEEVPDSPPVAAGNAVLTSDHRRLLTISGKEVDFTRETRLSVNLANGEAWTGNVVRARIVLGSFWAESEGQPVLKVPLPQIVGGEVRAYSPKRTATILVPAIGGPIVTVGILVGAFFLFVSAIGSVK